MIPFNVTGIAGRNCLYYTTSLEGFHVLFPGTGNEKGLPFPKARIGLFESMSVTVSAGDRDRGTVSRSSPS